MPKGQAPSNCGPPDSDPEEWRRSLTMSAGTHGPRQLGSEVLFSFPALRFDVFSPYRSSRYCGAPKPGKEKHKSYYYRSGILMVHGFRSFLSVFTHVLRKIWREVTQKIAAEFEARQLYQSQGGRGSVGAEKPRIPDAAALRLRARLRATRFGLA
jgi:hypothetical protein